MFEYIPEFNGLSNVIYDDFRNEEEREFLTSLYAHVLDFEKYGLSKEDFILFYDGETVTVAFDIIDKSENLVLRALRIDFNETNLLLGQDVTAQYVCKLHIDDPDVKEYRKSDYSISELADIAANWIETEAARKIECREWITSSYKHRVWVLTDSDKPISISDSKNVFRRDNLGFPTKITVVSPPTF